MAKKTESSAPLDLKRFWVCEQCSCVWEGVDPPENCDYCSYPYFQNCFDLWGDKFVALDE